MAASKQEGQAALSNAITVPLGIDYQDELLLPEDSFVSGSTTQTIGFGNTAQIAIKRFEEGTVGDVPLTWSTAEKAAFNAWAAGVPGGYDTYRVWLYMARVQPSGGAWTEVAYKVFGYVLNIGEDDDTWVGDTGWEQDAAFSVTGIEVWSEVDNGSSVYRETPRHFTDRSVTRYYLGDSATGNVTMAGTTVNKSYGTGSAAWMLDNFAVTLQSHKAPAANHAYSYIGRPYIGGSVDVPVTTVSFWYRSPGGWGAYWSDPGDAIAWCYADDGDDYKVKLEGLQAWATALSIQIEVEVRGPVTFTGEFGRMWPENTDTPLPTGARASTNVQVYTSETTLEDVWIGDGETATYVTGTWQLSSPGQNPPGTFFPAYLRTGTYLITWPFTSHMDTDYLEDNDRYFTFDPDEEYIAECNNSVIPIPLHSIEAQLDAADPYWGPSITLTHTDESIDIPPGESARPTSWVGSGGCTVAAEPDGGEWTVVVDAEAPAVDRTFVSRYPIKMQILAAWDEDYEGRTYGPEWGVAWDWIIHQKANDDPAGQIAEWPELAAVTTEDVTNWDNSKYLRLEFDSLPGSALGEQMVLTVDYDIYTPVCDFYEDIVDSNFGEDGTFDYTVSSHEATFYAILTGTGVALFDIGLAFNHTDTHAQHVTAARFELPNIAGDYIVKDITLYRLNDLEFQQAPDPWRWPMDFHGAGSTVDGCEHLNLYYGVVKEYVQRGMYGQQYLQRNPGSGPSSDPTYAKQLSRLVNELGQQQLTATYETATVDAATVDGEDNRLGALYWWDLKRERVASFDTALHVGAVTDANLPYCDQHFLLRWAGDGVGHGLVTSGIGANKVRVTSAGGFSDNAATYPYLLYRRANSAANWEECGSFDAEASGRFITPPNIEQGWEYAVSTGGMATPTIISPFDTREFACAHMSGDAVARWDPFACREPGGVLSWLIAEDGDGNCYAYWRDARETCVLQAAAIAPFEAGTHKRPSIAVDEAGRLLACATNTDTDGMEIKRSGDAGDSWGDAMAALGSGLEYGAIACWQGQVYLCGWDSDKVYLAVSTEDDLDRETLDGSNTLIEVCDYVVGEGEDIPRSSVVVHDDGRVIVAVDGDGSIVSYGCRNYQDAFSLIA